MHLVRELKANLLIETDILMLEEIVFDLSLTKSYLKSYRVSFSI